MSSDIVVAAKGGKKEGKGWQRSNLAMGVSSLAAHAIILGANGGRAGVQIPGTNAEVPAEGIALVTGALTVLLGGAKYKKIGVGQILGAGHAAITRGAMARSVKVTTDTKAGTTTVEAS